jgi:large subunit ribosomal protein L27
MLGTWSQMGFATKVMGGSTNNKKDSAGRRLGIKKWGHGVEIFEGDILARQRGFKWQYGKNVAAGKDHTLHSKVEVSY